MGTPLKVLILEDREADAELSVRELKKAGFDVKWRRAETEAEFRAGLDPALDVILVDYSLPQYSGVQALAEVKARGLDVPCIVVTGAITDEQAVATLRAGAVDYVLKDRLARLAPAVQRALEERKVTTLVKQTEQALHQNQERLHTIITNMRDVLWSMDLRDQRITFVSQAIHAITGRTDADFLREPGLWLSTIHPDDRGAMAVELRKNISAAGGSTNVRLLHTDGSVRHVRMRAWVANDPNGNPLRMDGILTDTTAEHAAAAEHERAEAIERQRLAGHRAGELRYRSLFQNMLAGYARCRLEFNDDEPSDATYLETNASFERITGLKDVIGKTANELVPGFSVDNRDALEAYARVVRLGVPEEFEAMLPGLHGAWLHVAAYPASGNEFVATFTDITRRKAYELDLSRQKELLERAEAAGKLGSWSMDLATGDGEWSKEKYRLVDVDPGTPPTRELFLSRVHPDDRAAPQAQIDAALADPSATEVRSEYRVVRRDGEVRLHQDQIRITRDGTGRPVALLGTTQDITEQRKVDELQESVRSKDAALEVAKRNSQFKAQFLNMAAHDLATPITPLLLQVATLRMKAIKGGDADLVKAFDMLDRNLVRLSGLITDVLDVGRIEAGRVKLRPEPIDLAQVAQDTMDTVRAMADAKKLHLAADVEPTPVTSDAGRVAQVVLNLLSNAVKFTPEGGHVTVRLRSDVQQAQLEVSDDGRGISAEDLKKLFQPFGRVGDVAKVQGTGLGLYISQGLARAMGGDLTAASPGEGKGSTFTLRLPLQPPVSPDAAQMKAVAFDHG